VDAYSGSSTKTGLAIKALQDAVPNARVLYSSATGASEPANLGYMVRLLPPGFSTTFEMVEELKVCGRCMAFDHTTCNCPAVMRLRLLNL